MVGYTEEQLEKAVEIVTNIFKAPAGWVADGFHKKAVYHTSVEIALRAMGVTEMTPEKKHVYVNLYRASNGTIWVGSPNKSREEANNNIAMNSTRIGCKRIVEGEFDD